MRSRNTTNINNNENVLNNKGQIGVFRNSEAYKIPHRVVDTVESTDSMYLPGDLYSRFNEQYKRPGFIID